MKAFAIGRAFSRGAPAPRVLVAAPRRNELSVARKLPNDCTRADPSEAKVSEGGDAFASVRGVRAPRNILALCALALFVCAAAAHGQEADTFSPVASYQYEDSLTESGTPIMSPVVSYQYYDWPGDENLTFANSPNVSYFYGSIANGVTISGPSTLGTGTQATYSILLSVDGIPVDVTAGSRLSFAGPRPAFAELRGTTLFVGRDAPVATIQVLATYTNRIGQLTSAPFSVAITKSFNAAATVGAQNTGGTNYQVMMNGTASGGAAPYVFSWDTNNDGTYGDVTGATASFSGSSQGGTFRIGLEVSDSSGAKAYARASATIDKPPVANQPPRVRPTAMIGSGALYGSDGHLFQFNSARVHQGFIVLTHGMYANGFDPWIRDMARRVEERVNATNPAKTPNIAVYDWGEDSNPSGDVDPVRLALLDLLGRFSPIWLLGQGANIAQLSDFLIDCGYVRQRIAPTHGQALAAWIWSQARDGLIDPEKPIQLVGHSAGGFLIGDCALWFKQHPLPGGRYITVDRVTMLDTPFVINAHLTALPNPGVVEQVTSSVYGALEWPGTQNINPGTFYNYKTLAGFDRRFSFGETGHGLSYRWYNRTIKTSNESDGIVLDGYGRDGFNLSPFVGGYSVHGPISPPASDGPRKSELLKEFRTIGPKTGVRLVSQSIGGFETFGSVTLAGNIYTLTEQADAGLVIRNFTMPIGVRKLMLRFAFTSPGDGDFLNVRFGDDYDLYTGLDNVLSRDGFTTIEVPLDALDGKTSDLVVTLVSRGSPNAVLQIGGFELIVDADADADGLTNAEEATLGTDPLRADTDGDGLSDGDEVHVYHTNPLAADTDGDGVSDAAEIAAGTDPLNSGSRLRITNMSHSLAAGITISWTAKLGKAYQIQRSQDLSFATYEVIASNLNGVEPEASFSDMSAPVSLGVNVYYRVALQP